MTTWQARIEAIRESKAFEATVIFVILVAAVLVGAKTYDIPPAIYQLVDALGNVVVWIFVAELAVRFLASRPRYAFFKNAWNLFDTIVVAVSLLPVEGSEMALVARLARIFQVLRMIGVITEVRLLLNSLLRAIPQLMYVLVMVFLIFYIYGALGSLFFEPVDPALWGNIGVAMLTLFQVMTLDEWARIMDATMERYWWSWLYYLSFIFFTTCAFLNLIIGVIVNVLRDEHDKVITADPDKISNENLYQEIQKLKALLNQQHQGSGPKA